MTSTTTITEEHLREIAESSEFTIEEIRAAAGMTERIARLRREYPFLTDDSAIVLIACENMPVSEE